jgi:hypothetical protein
MARDFCEDCIIKTLGIYGLTYTNEEELHIKLLAHEDQQYNHIQYTEQLTIKIHIHQGYMEQIRKYGRIYEISDDEDDYSYQYDPSLQFINND